MVRVPSTDRKAGPGALFSAPATLLAVLTILLFVCQPGFAWAQTLTEMRSAVEARSAATQADATDPATEAGEAPSLLNLFPAYRNWKDTVGLERSISKSRRGQRSMVRVRGGTEARAHEFSDMVVTMASPDNGTICSGMAFTRHAILTAAHCACKHMRLSRIGWGKSAREEDEFSTKVGRTLAYFPDGVDCANDKATTPGRDYGLIVIENPLPIGDGLRVTRMISAATFRAVKAGDEVYIAGYGERSIGGPSGEKFFTISPIISRDCDSRLERRLGCLSKKEFIAQDEYVTCPWRDDSGGGAFLIRPGKPQVLLGVIARTTETGRCIDGAIYTTMTPQRTAELRQQARRLERKLRAGE